jgi:signal transduction histidine kinase
MMRTALATDPASRAPMPEPGAERLDAFDQRARRYARRLAWQIAGVGIALVVALWGVIIMIAHFEARSAVERARGQGENLTAAFAAETTRLLDLIVAMMEQVTAQIRDDLAAGGLNRERVDAALAGSIGPRMQALVIDSDGRLLYNNMHPAMANIDFRQREEFAAHRRSTALGLQVGHPILGQPGQAFSLPVTHRISGRDGQFLGVLMFALAPAHVSRLHRSVNLGQHGVLSLLCPDGLIRVRFSAGQPDGLTGVGTSLVGRGFDAALPAGGISSYVQTDIADSIPRFFTLHRLTDYDLFVNVGLGLDEILAPARRQKLLLVGVGATVSLLIAALTMLLMREIWRRTLREIDLARQHARLEEAHAQILRDRERLAATNRELVATAERADAASQAKSRFLANMSHELRTPLHAIIGFSELIRERVPRSGPVAVLGDYAADILASGRHLLELINTVLDLSRVESGASLVVEAVVPLSDVINASLISIRSQARARGIAVRVDLPANAPQLRVDLTKMRQVLINLLSNAVKFTPEGGSVAISAAMAPEGGLVITVADTGIGMTAAEVEIAMEPFGQVDSTLSRSAEGTGLGLPLALRLTELHGGQLRIRSVKGEGTTVEVVLPADRVIADRAAVPTG